MSRNFCRLLGGDVHKSFRKNSDSPLALLSIKSFISHMASSWAMTSLGSVAAMPWVILSQAWRWFADRLLWPD